MYLRGSAKLSYRGKQIAAEVGRRLGSHSEQALRQARPTPRTSIRFSLTESGHYFICESTISEIIHSLTS